VEPRNRSAEPACMAAATASEGSATRSSLHGSTSHAVRVGGVHLGKIGCPPQRLRPILDGLKRKCPSLSGLISVCFSKFAPEFTIHLRVGKSAPAPGFGPVRQSSMLGSPTVAPSSAVTSLSRTGPGGRRGDHHHWRAAAGDSTTVTHLSLLGHVAGRVRDTGPDRERAELPERDGERFRPSRTWSVCPAAALPPSRREHRLVRRVRLALT